jgi:hypothetical protein
MEEQRLAVLYTFHWVASSSITAAVLVALRTASASASVSPLYFARSFAASCSLTVLRWVRE